MFEEIPPIFPLSFFDISFDVNFLNFKIFEDFDNGNFLKIFKKKYLIPNMSKYLKEEKFADIYMGWNEEGIYFFVDVKKRLEEVFSKNYRRGDSIELFLDTRCLKSNFITKYCHHFVLFAEKVDGYHVKEVTKFRGDDIHKIAKEEDFDIKVFLDKNSYSMKIFIPKRCLYGYDVKNFKKMGFTYRVNRYLKESQNFSASDLEFNFEKFPFLWGEANLIK